MATGDALGADPAALEEAVLLDRLLRVARAGGLVAAAGGQPREHDPVEPDQPDPDRLTSPWVLRVRRPWSRSPAQCPDQRVVVGLDDRGPGDDEDVPAGLERGRHHPERLAESTPDPVADHRPTELSPGRESEPGRLEVRPQEPGGEEGWDRVVPPPRIAAKSCGRESITSRGVVSRARSSGRQPLSTTCPSCCDHAPTTGSPHPGAEAVFLGAVALLGLVGPLHRDCPGSSSSGLGRRSCRPLKARKRAGRQKARGASSSGG